MLSQSSEYVRMTIMCPPDIVHPAKGDHLAVSIANYAHHNDSRRGGVLGRRSGRRGMEHTLWLMVC